MAKMAKYKKKILDEFESRNDDWSFGDFEKRITELKPGSYYQDAKMAIIEGHKAGLWPNTVKRYILTTYSAYGDVNIEFNDIFDKIYSSLSSDEKKIWKLSNTTQLNEN